MKQIYFSLLYLAISINSIAQTASSFKPKVNNIPTSPEAALLERFGDIPVGYYTGSANISIPLYTIEESGVQVPIVLSYNATGIKVADEATWVGLGWSLEPGGAIIQEVRGKEDAFDTFYSSSILGSSGDQWQTFKTTLGPINSGTHYRAFQNGDNLKAPTGVLNPNIGPGTDAQAILNNLLDGNGQPDIYNYNLPGYSGKYYKNPETGELVFIDKKTNLYINGNTITSPEGNVFAFNDVEITHGSNFSLLSGITSKLSLITFTNGKIIKFTYATENYSAFLQRSSVVLNPYPDACNNNDPDTPATYTDVTYGTKKRLIQIETEDTYINFIPEARQDLLVDSANNLQRLKQIDIVSKITGKKIKSFVFTYSYFNASSDYHSKRLKLDSVKEIGYSPTEVADNTKPAYTFTYDTSVTLPAKESMAVDFWGYYNGQNTNGLLIPDLRYFEYEHDSRYTTNGAVNFNRYAYTGANRFPDNSKAKAYMLQKIVYPTGGYTEFTFEPHVFNNQYIPTNAQVIQADKTITRNKNNTYTSYTDYFQQFSIGRATTLRFHNTFSHGSPITNDNLDSSIIGNIFNNASITLSKAVAGTSTILKTWHPYDFMTIQEFTSAGTITWDENVWIPFEEGAVYTLSVNYPTFTYTYANAYMAQTYAQCRYYDDSDMEKISTHGGFRVSSIKSYTDTGVLASHKQINYYEGKLLNLFEPLESMNVEYGCKPPGSEQVATCFTRKRISISSDDFGLNGGNSIGYGKVEEIELASNGTDNNGMKTFYYVNEVNQSLKGLPKSLYLKNGLLTKEEIRDKQLTKLRETSYVYSNLSNFSSYFGVVIQTNHIGNYDWGNQNPAVGPNVLDVGTVDYKFSYGVYPIISEWNMLQNVTTKEYFNGTEVISTQAFTYNSNGHEKTITSTFATGEQASTTLYYAGEVSGAPASETQMIADKMTGIPVYTEQYNGTELLSSQRTEYAKDISTGNHMLPKYIYHKKGNESTVNLQRRITFDKYDDKGNILQYTLENGTPICFIWGYKKSMPVATIENATYDTFSSTVNSLISSAQTYSDTNDETSLIPTLTNLRVNLPNAMVTTYMYRPGVGVNTITDAKADKTTYTYDDFGRLIAVRDKNGKLLSENSYNYRP